MAELHLRFLGYFQVTCGERPVTAFESDKVRALLAYLAVEAAQAHPRSVLAALLWPDYDENSARASLRQALYQLRQVIGDVESAPALLLITRQTLQFNQAAAYQSDAATFMTLLQRCTNHAHAQLEQCPSCLQQLQQAVDLYQGEFLAGFAIDDSAPFEEWRRIKQEQFHLQALDALTILADVDEAAGELERAQHYTRRLLILEPWREEAHRQLIRLLARTGQRAAALAHYQNCRQVLAAELGVEPSAATVTLVEQIRTGTFLPVTENARVETHPPAIIVQTPSPEVDRPFVLPEPITPFIGREKELAEVIKRLQQPEVRLLTLVGAGGMGKTRLALQAAKGLCDEPLARDSQAMDGAVLEEKYRPIRQAESENPKFADGVFFVALAPLLAVADIVPSIATILGITLLGGNPEQALRNFVQNRQILLILDNFEHLLEGANLLAALLQHAPGLRILVTSRTRLNLRGEHVHTVQGMDYDVGDSLAAAGASSAVRLFVQSVRRVQPSFKLAAANYTEVLAICQLVQGMPLGLELAAAWSEHLSLAEIRDEIQQSADFLATNWQDVPERQRSLRAVFEWSWQMLGASERQAFRQLSIFRGGFTREAANAVATVALRVLTHLVDKSLLAVRDFGQRYEMHELLRQFAAEQLDALPDERAATADHHSDYYLNFVATRESHLMHNEPQQAVREIQHELDNVRQAWLQATNQRNSALLGKSVGGLVRYYDLAGLLNESVQALGRAAEKLENAKAAPLLGTEHERSQHQLCSKLLALQGSMLMKQGKFDKGITSGQAALALALASGAIEGGTYAQLVVGQGFFRKSQLTEARACFEHVLALTDRYQQPGSTLDLLIDVEYTAYLWLGQLEAELGNFAAAQARYAAGIRFCQRHNRLRAEVHIRINHASLLSHMRDYAAARQIYAEFLPITRSLGCHWSEAMILLELGDAVRMLGEYTLASELLRHAEVQLAKSGATLEPIFAYITLARLYCYLGATEQARHWLARAFGTPMLQESLWLKLMVLLARAVFGLQTGKHAQVVNDLQEAIQVGQTLNNPSHQAQGLLLLGHAHSGLQQWQAAEQSYQQASTIYQKLGNVAVAAEARAGLAWLALTQGEPSRAAALVEELLPLLQGDTAIGLDEPFFVYLTCYRILSTLHDHRAPEILSIGYKGLQQYIDHIHDETLRSSFLKNVPVHRALHEAYTSERLIVASVIRDS